jgi:hypothetical protein
VVIIAQMKNIIILLQKYIYKGMKLQITCSQAHLVQTHFHIFFLFSPQETLTYQVKR